MGIDVIAIEDGSDEAEEIKEGKGFATDVKDYLTVTAIALGY